MFHTAKGNVRKNNLSIIYPNLLCLIVINYQMKECKRFQTMILKVPLLIIDSKLRSNIYILA